MHHNINQGKIEDNIPRNARDNEKRKLSLMYAYKN